MLFDSHAHLITDDVKRYPPDPLSGRLASGDLDNPVTAEALLRMMDANDVERALVVQRAHVYGFDNSYAVDSADKYPDRLTAMCMIDALGEEAPSVIRYWVEERGAIAVRLTEPNKGAGPEWFVSEQALETWETVRELGVSMRLHFYGWNRDFCMPELSVLLEMFPSIPVVLDHLSSPPPEAGANGIDGLLEDLAYYPNVSLLFSTINYLRLQQKGHSIPAVLQRAVDIFGSERLMWGSDIAQSAGSYEEMVIYARQAVSELNETDRENVLYRNGVRLYGRADN